MADADLYMATDSFITSVDGQDVVVHAGHTVVRAGHPLLAGREGQFRPLVVHFDVEPPKPERQPDKEDEVQARPAPSQGRTTQPRSRT